MLVLVENLSEIGKILLAYSYDKMLYRILGTRINN
jgi:hypothetical protein